MFHHDLAFRYFKGLARRTASDEILRDKAFNIAKNPKCDEFERGLASMVYKFFDKNSKIYGIIQNQQLAEEMQKSIIRNFEKKKHSSFKDNICGADLSNLQLINKFNKEIRFLLCVIDILVNMHRLFF